MDGEREAGAAPAAAGGQAPPDAADAPRAAAGGEDGCSGRFGRRERAALDALRTLLRDLETAHFGVRPDPVPEAELHLRLRVRPSDAWALWFDPPLAEQVLEQAGDWLARCGVFRPGAVYCYKCGSAACAHACPPGPMSVFGGYDPMGLAEWRELAQVLIEERDERIDRLFAEPPRMLARAQAGRQLRMRQLGSFGRRSRSYAILGQVVAGPLACDPAPRAGRTPRARMALTFHIVETRDERGAWRLRLNTLGALPGRGELGEFLDSGEAAWVTRARDAAREAVAGIEARVIEGRGRGDAERVRRELAGVPVVLRRLAQSLERGDRQDRRRTPHARQRRQEQRPVHKAVEDARCARPDAWFFDEKTLGFVVCGPHGRAHVFAADGRHVTSMTLSPGAAAFRVRTRRWRPAEPGEVCGVVRALAEPEDGG